MVKSRFTPVDVCGIVHCLKKSLVGLRVANIYDLNPKTYLLKFAAPDKKVFLLIESGIRIHTTEFQREKNNIPSLFSLKVLFTVASSHSYFL
jgi:predicted ribosome quality control (RQC) complex YloA/Tae2 family protein